MFPTANGLATLQRALGGDLALFVPELILAGGIVLLLGVRLFPAFDRLHLGPVALFLSAAALGVASLQWLALGDGILGGTAFSGMLAMDTAASFFRVYLLAFAVLVLILNRLTRLVDAEDSADFATLVLGGTLGFLLMASANHLLMVFLAIEMASLPGYVLSAFRKGDPRGSEAALKYVVFGAAASGAMLFGISLLAGSLGTGYLPSFAEIYARHLREGFELPLAAGTLLLLAGFAFKLAAVPAHFWLPDVFEGAPAEVGAMLAVASKAAALGLLLRVLLSLAAATRYDPTILPRTVGVGIAVVSAATMTFGNLMAYNQTNLKRLLGYSTIAHAGTMLMAVAVITPAGGASVAFYLVGYLPATLGAFAVVALVRNRTGSEDVSSLRGLVARSPWLGVAFGVFVLSLLGLPPFAGFAGKFQVFAEAYRGGYSWLLGIGVLNTALSAGYYLRLLRTIAQDEPAGGALGEAPAATAFVGVLAAATLVLGIAWDPIDDAATKAMSAYRPAADPSVILK